MTNKLIIAFSFILMGSCAHVGDLRNDVDVAITRAQAAGEAARNAIGPIINEVCRQSAVECVNAGITEPSKCENWVKCDAVREHFGRLLVALQYAVMDAKLALAVGDEASAMDAVRRATELALKIQLQLKESGLL